MVDKKQLPISLEELRKKHKKLRDREFGVGKKMSKLDLFAVWITSRIGTSGFFILIITWTTLWLGWNTFAPKDLQFDPPVGFVFWLFISNMIQLMLMPLIMIGQNMESRQAEARMQYDLEINIKAEEEIEVVLKHLEYQQALLLEMIKKLEGK